MEIITVSLKLVELILTRINLWEKDKYRSKLLKLKMDFYNEYNKERPDMAAIDNITIELRELCEAIYTEATAKNACD